MSAAPDLLAEIRALQRMPETLSESHAEIRRLRGELEETRIDLATKLHAALEAEARANARAADMADRLAEFAWSNRQAWIGIFSQKGIARICRSAGMRVSKRGGELPTKGSMLGRLQEHPTIGPDRINSAIADLFDQFEPEDFEK